MQGKSDFLMKFRREVVKQLLMTKLIKILSMPSFTWTGQNLNMRV